MNHIIILIFIHGLFAEEIRLPDGRLFNVPNPEDFPYIFDEYPSSLQRLYVLSLEHYKGALLCPKGYAMLEMSQDLITNDSYSMPNGVAKHHTALLMDLKGPDRISNPPCPIVYDCLGYQACLFEFNLDFCPHLTSLLGPMLLLTIVCFRDETEVVPLKFKKKKDLVLHIYQKYLSLQENNLSHLELPEDEVFGRQCSPPEIAKKSEGFFGSCLQNPPSAEVTSQQLWPLLGKTLSASCRNHLLQVYCAFQYDNEGFCLPPMYHNKNNKSDGIFSLSALPAARYHSHCNVRSENLTKQTLFLKPARLAFMIMVHDGYQQAMDLLSAIYREEFLYVVHVNKQNPDLRRELDQLISQSNFPSHNIYILPEERSFVTPLSSYENVRAQLEGFSELLCLDSWDFVISLSEYDIPLRNVDDLAAALSPYRGFSFLSLLPNSANDDDKEYVLNDSAFSACDGFVYKVAYRKPTSKLNIFRTYGKGALSRNFTAYIVNETMRLQVLNDHQFYMQTDILPAESYIPTVLMNSPHREFVYFASIFSTIDLKVGNYLSEFYICKNHSELECSGIEELISRSHSSFFVRFRSQPPPDIREFALSLAKDNYYALLEKLFPPILQRLIVEDAMKRFSAKEKLPSDQLHVESIMKFQIAPSLVPQDPCCASDSLSNYSEITDFSYWIAANLFNRTSGKYIESRLMLQSSLPNRFCFRDGDLRMAFISPWIEHLNPSDRQYSRFTPEIIMPLPFGPAFTDDILINLFFSMEVVNSNCRINNKGNPILSPMNTNNFTDFIILNLQLISPDYQEKCTTNILLKWENEKTKTFSQQKRRAIIKSFVMRCKNMEPGKWTLQIREMEPVKSDVYRFPLYLLDLQQSGDLASQLSEVVHLWDLKHFLLLNDEHTFEFFEPETQDENLDSPKKRVKLPNFHNSENTKQRTSNSDFHQWFICSGGFASTFSVCLLIVLVYYRKSRFHQNLVWVFLLSMILIVLLQIALYVTLCGQ